jgi:hypothetical protein
MSFDRHPGGAVAVAAAAAGLSPTAPPEPVVMDDAGLAHLLSATDAGGFLPTQLGQQLSTLAAAMGADVGAWRRVQGRLASAEARSFVGRTTLQGPVQVTEADFLGPKMAENKVQALMGRHLRRAMLDADYVAMHNVYGLTELAHRLVTSGALASPATATKTLGVLRDLLALNYGAHTHAVRAVEQQVVSAGAFFWLDAAQPGPVPDDVTRTHVLATDPDIVKKTQKLGQFAEGQRKATETAPGGPARASHNHGGGGWRQQQPQRPRRGGGGGAGYGGGPRRGGGQSAGGRDPFFTGGSKGQ